jgi:hypothetical protein
MTARAIPMTTETLRHWCGQLIAHCGAVVLGVLASSTDAGPGVSVDDVRLMAWRIFQWVRK